MKPKYVIVEMDNGMRFVYDYPRYIRRLKATLIQHKMEDFISAYDLKKRNDLLRGS